VPSTTLASATLIFGMVCLPVTADLSRTPTMQTLRPARFLQLPNRPSSYARPHSCARTYSADGFLVRTSVIGQWKLVVTPDEADWASRRRADNAMVKALALAFRWRKMLDSSVHATLKDLARSKGVNESM